jgi:hypothetical protein
MSRLCNALILFLCLYLVRQHEQYRIKLVTFLLLSSHIGSQQISLQVHLPQNGPGLSNTWKSLIASALNAYRVKSALMRTALQVCRIY